MAFTQIRGGGMFAPEHREYACDTIEDLGEIVRQYRVLPIGTIARVIETGDFYVLNSSNEWVKQTRRGSGSDGGSDSGGTGIMWVTVTYEDAVGDEDIFTADKSFSEIFSAVEAGTLVKAKMVGLSGWMIYDLTMYSQDKITFVSPTTTTTGMDGDLKGGFSVLEIVHDAVYGLDEIRENSTTFQPAIA